MEHKISLEDLIDNLIEIRDRFQKGQPKVLTTTGIVFGYRDSSIDGGIDFHMSRECLNDLKLLYKRAEVEVQDFVPNITFDIGLKLEMNILEMVVRSKAIGLAEVPSYLSDLMRTSKFYVNGQIINNIFYMVSDGDIVDIKDIVHIMVVRSQKS